MLFSYLGKNIFLTCFSGTFKEKNEKERNSQEQSSELMEQNVTSRDN